MWGVGSLPAVWPAAACGEGEKSKQTARPAYVMSSGRRAQCSSTVVGDEAPRHDSWRDVALHWGSSPRAWCSS